MLLFSLGEADYTADAITRVLYTMLLGERHLKHAHYRFYNFPVSIFVLSFPKAYLFIFFLEIGRIDYMSIHNGRVFNES